MSLYEYHRNRRKRFARMMDQLAHSENQNSCTQSVYFPLFQHMQQEHNLSLTDGQLSDIIDVAVDLHNKLYAEQNKKDENT